MKLINLQKLKHCKSTAISSDLKLERSQLKIPKHEEPKMRGRQAMLGLELTFMTRARPLRGQVRRRDAKPRSRTYSSKEDHNGHSAHIVCINLPAPQLKYRTSPFGRCFDRIEGCFCRRGVAGRGNAENFQ